MPLENCFTQDGPHKYKVKSTRQLEVLCTSLINSQWVSIASRIKCPNLLRINYKVCELQNIYKKTRLDLIKNQDEQKYKSKFLSLKIVQ